MALITADAYRAYDDPATPLRVAARREVVAPIRSLPDFDLAAILIISLVCNTFKISINGMFQLLRLYTYGVCNRTPSRVSKAVLKQFPAFAVEKLVLDDPERLIDTDA